MRISADHPAILEAQRRGLIPRAETKAARRKYRNQPCEVDGLRFDSRREAGRWVLLKAMVSAGEIHGLRRQCPIRVMVNGVKVCDYIADFVYVTRSGVEIVEDAKGMRTAVYKLKKRLVKAACGIDIQEI